MKTFRLFCLFIFVAVLPACSVTVGTVVVKGGQGDDKTETAQEVTKPVDVNTEASVPAAALGGI